jgi:carboxymethylenebutenolidase
MISFNRPDGQPVRGYLAEPATGAEAPGIVVIQEWWGLNAQIKGVADQLAAAGYRALVPDLYRGKSTVEGAEAEHLMKGLDFADAAGQDIAGAVQHLRTSGSAKVGMTGFCMGGALTLLAAVHVAGVDAAVVWYGYPPLDYVDAGRITAPLLAHWAIHDDFFPIAGVDALEARLTAAGVNFDFHRYDARHAFANEEADERHMSQLKYAPEASALAWERTMAFLSIRL